MIKEIFKQILEEEFNLTTKKETDTSNHASHLVGKICMFRTYSAGVHFGELVSRDGRECLIKDARRVWSWSGACSLSQLAMEGSKDTSGCKIAISVNEILLTEVIEIIPMKDSAIKNLIEIQPWKI